MSTTELQTVSTMPACPKPGIYPGVSFADYCKIPAMNCSTLAWASDDMEHLKAAMDGKLHSEDSKAMEWGRAMHIRILEPARYAEAVHLRGTCSAILKSGERKGEPCGATGVGMVDGVWYCGKHGGDDASLPVDQEFLTASDLSAIEMAAESIKKHKAENLRKAPGLYEVVAIADLMGVRCKCRLDKWIEPVKRIPATIVDCKKVAAAKRPGEACSEREFNDKIAYYRYGMQAAMYCDIMEALTGTLPRWFWIVVEDGYPYSTGVFRASEKCLNAGRNQYRGYLTNMLASQQSNEWPGITRDVVDVDGPAWWIKENGGL